MAARTVADHDASVKRGRDVVRVALDLGRQRQTASAPTETGGGGHQARPTTAAALDPESPAQRDRRS